jgi:hypothetical protein
MKKVSGSLIAIVLSVSLGALFPGGAFAAPVTTEMAPEADNWLNSCPAGYSQQNGCEAQCSDYKYQELRLRAWDNGPRVFRSILRFNVSALAGRAIQDAKLKIYWYAGHWNTPTIQKTVEVYEVTSAWEECHSQWRYRDIGTLTEWESVDVWNPMSPYYSGTGGTQGGGGDYGDLIDSTTLQWTGDGTEADWENFTGEWVEFDVTGAVQAWVDGDPNNGFFIKLQNETVPMPEGTTVYQFLSKEAKPNGTDPSHPWDDRKPEPVEDYYPSLEITYDDGSGGCAAAAPAEAATRGASQTSGSLSHLLIVLVPAALVIGLKRMRRRFTG